MKICPLMSTAQNMAPCVNECALKVDGECAFANIARSLSEPSPTEPDRYVLDSDGDL